MTNHPNRSRRITREAKEFGASRETSDEVSQAILDLATEHSLDPQRIWEDPSPTEETAALARAWDLTDEDVLFWGGSHKRPSAA